MRLHRKAAIRLLHRTDQPRAGKRRGRSKQYGPDIVLLDIIIHGINGLEMLRRLRKFSNMRVLVLSAKEQIY